MSNSSTLWSFNYHDDDSSQELDSTDPLKANSIPQSNKKQEFEEFDSRSNQDNIIDIGLIEESVIKVPDNPFTKAKLNSKLKKRRRFEEDEEDEDVNKRGKTFPAFSKPNEGQKKGSNAIQEGFNRQMKNHAASPSSKNSKSCISFLPVTPKKKTSLNESILKSFPSTSSSTSFATSSRISTSPSTTSLSSFKYSSPSISTAVYTPVLAVSRPSISETPTGSESSKSSGSSSKISKPLKPLPSVSTQNKSPEPPSFVLPTLTFIPYTPSLLASSSSTPTNQITPAPSKSRIEPPPLNLAATKFTLPGLLPSKLTSSLAKKVVEVKPLDKLDFRGKKSGKKDYSRLKRIASGEKVAGNGAGKVDGDVNGIEGRKGKLEVAGEKSKDKGIKPSAYGLNFNW